MECSKSSVCACAVEPKKLSDGGYIHTANHIVSNRTLSSSMTLPCYNLTHSNFKLGRWILSIEYLILLSKSNAT